MNGVSIHIAGMGVVSALGCGIADTIQALESNRQVFGPVTLFPVAAGQSLNVGMVDLGQCTADVPRTHRLARHAADQALAEAGPQPPDAIVVGTTTGGILTTEALLEQEVGDAPAYARHGAGTVAEDLACRCGCTGPALTVSTACSSGAVALKLAMEMLRSGRFKRVLAGGADSLSRLTYFGFKSLQLIDPAGARPMDRQRRGMTVAEGAAMLLLATGSASHQPIQILGAALSCDAHHATAPHPDGLGAKEAMQAALEDAGLEAGAIDYINLHGTGTKDNDLSEARAVRALFGGRLPPLSSIKGATGHTLAAAGAIEAVVAAAAIRHGLAPGNAGFSTPDPDLNLLPLREPKHTPINTVLSNSFGFGGNNAAVVVGRPRVVAKAQNETAALPMIVRGSACISGAGHLQATREAFEAGRTFGGCLDDAGLCEGLPPRLIRRLKRLPRLALALASRTCEGLDPSQRPVGISLGTGWGALSETHDFLKRLVEIGQAYPSPTDFVGSVHNAPAGQIAMLLAARGANVTASGGDYSFEQALWSAEWLGNRGSDPILVLGTDEHHSVLSGLFDASVRLSGEAADGGGALLLQRACGPGVGVAMVDYRSGADPDWLNIMLDRLGGAESVRRTCGVVLAGCPAAHRDKSRRQLTEFVAAAGYDGPVIDYRRFTGEFAAASAVAAVMGVEMVRCGRIPAAHAGGAERPLNARSALLLGLGPYVTAARISAL